MVGNIFIQGLPHDSDKPECLVVIIDFVFSYPLEQHTEIESFPGNTDITAEVEEKIRAALAEDGVELSVEDTQAQLDAEDAELERLDGMGDLLDDEGFDDFLGSDE